MNFKDAANFDRITKEIEKLQANKQNGNDDRLWQPGVDKAGNGLAVIRFLPTPPMDIKTGAPWVKVFSHGFKGPTGKWYIENSLTTLGQTDPVSEANSLAWNAGDQATARRRARRTNYIANVYVVDDPANPENNGKVFLFRFGTKIFEKIQEAMKPAFADEKPLNPFDLLNGANFKLKIVNKDGYRNYDKSVFAKSAPLFDDEDKLNEIWQKEYSLLEFIDPANFKSYADLKKRFDEVESVGSILDQEPVSRKNASKTLADEIDDEIPFETGKSANDEDKTLDYFRNLADE